ERYSAAVEQQLATQGREVNREEWKRRNFNYLWPSRLLKAKEEIAQSIPLGKGYVLIDNNELNAESLIPDRRAVQLVEHEGTYWGPPADDNAAAAKLERLSSQGLEYVVLWWTAFWWLTEYSKLQQYLHDNATRLVENDALRIYRLRKPKQQRLCASPF